MAQSRTRVALVATADAHKVGERGKVDAFGLFSLLGIWGTPTQRACAVVAAFDNVPAGTTNFQIWIRNPRGKIVKIAKGHFKRTTPSLARAYTAQQIPFPISLPGLHHIGVSLGKGKTASRAAWTPLRISIMPWPRPIDGDLLRSFLDDPHSVKTARAIVSCKKCKRTYTFEAHIDPSAKPGKGALQFPADGVFHCKRCSTPLFLKDLEGQVRTQLIQSATLTPRT